MSKHSDTTPLRTVTIAANNWLRTPLALAGSAAVVVFLAGWWASNVWRDIQDLKEGQKRQSDDIAQIKAWLNPTAPKPSVVSRNDR